MEVTSENMKQIALREFRLSPGSPHAFDHWERVYENIKLLSAQFPAGEVNHKICIAFAYLHDCKREYDGIDNNHGDNAAIFVDSLDLDLKSEEKKLLLNTLKFHNTNAISEIPTTAVCWDADRLDIIRVGIIPHPSLMNTKLGKYIANMTQLTEKITKLKM